MFKKFVSFIALVVVFASCCSARCAEERVWFTSCPEEAQVIIDGYDCGTTPVLVALNKKYNHYVYICKEGYQPQDGWLITRKGSNSPLPLIGAIIGAGIGIACASSSCPLPDILLGTALGATAGGLINTIDTNTPTCSERQFHVNLEQ